MSTLRDLFGLTPRQEECLQLVAEGASHKDIMRLLGIEQKTCESHIHSAKKKLGGKNIANTIAIALINGGLSGIRIEKTTVQQGIPRRLKRPVAKAAGVPALHTAGLHMGGEGWVRLMQGAAPDPAIRDLAAAGFSPASDDSE